MNTLDSRDLIEESNALKQEIWESFLENFPHYEDMTETFEDIRFEEEEVQSWKEDWLDEIVTITDIERLQDEVGSEWDYGVTLIDEDDFEDYCEELCTDIGYISKDFPNWIKIDWEATANNMRQDYSEVVYNEITYLYR